MDEQHDPEMPPRPSHRGKIGLGILALVVVGISVAMASGGRDTLWSDEGGGPPPTAVKPVAAVAAKPAAKPAQAEGDIRGVIQSQSEAVISSRVTARITAMPFKSGERFTHGAMLARFDCAQTRAQLTAANAATSAYRKTYETNAELDAYQAVGKNEVEIAKANVDKASAEANAISAQLVDCAIFAPFSGMVVEQIAHPHEVAASGQPLMKIQNSTALEVQLIVPSRWLTWLKPGTPFTFKVDETGSELTARVTRLGAAVDPVSKTLRVVGSIQTTSGVVLPGMSGSARFAEPVAQDGVKG
ncbi:efflux RND transporter periplasmic adaptor subunit [Sphingomonas sp.]|uniref:efflux RND transporter periplasmic adaptor subunit n=1 Tax=Sphingomonas sp. TaxID=28214 RepID=UPI003D6CF63E